MSLRFACPHCQQKLSVSADKAGIKTACPKCKKPLVVPHSPSASSSAIGTRPPVPAPAPNRSAPPAFDQFEVYDDDTEIIYDTDEAPHHPGGTPNLQDRLLIPRWAVYALGGTLASVSFLCFVIGMFVGGLGSGGGQANGPRTGDLYGRITFDLSQRLTGDDGAFVLALPQQKAPDEKAPTADMFPGNGPAPADHLGLKIIQLLGGNSARADKDGNFKMALPRGDYFVLVISNNKTSEKNVPTSDAAQMGRFLEQPVDFIGRRMYRWEKVTIRGDQRYDVLFE